MPGSAKSGAGVPNAKLVEYVSAISKRI